MAAQKKANLDSWWERVARTFAHLAQVGLVALGIGGYIFTVKPTYDRQLLENNIEDLQRAADAAAEAIVELVVVRELEDLAKDQASPKLFSGFPWGTFPSLDGQWISNEDAVAQLLDNLKNKRLKELAPRLTQSNIDSQLQRIRDKVADASKAMRCTFDSIKWAEVYAEEKYATYFGVPKCVEFRIDQYLTLQGASQKDVKSAGVNKRVLRRLREEYGQMCLDDRVGEVNAKFDQEWAHAVRTCRARLTYAAKAINDAPYEPPKLLEFKPPSSSAAKHEAADEKTLRAAQRIRSAIAPCAPTPLKCARPPKAGKSN